MPPDRRAQVLAVLAWLATLPHGYEWAERWRAEFAAELAALETGKGEAV
jgi:hypothetical protein